MNNKEIFLYSLIGAVISSVAIGIVNKKHNEKQAKANLEWMLKTRNVTDERIDRYRSVH